MTALGESSEQLLHGRARPAELIDETKTALRALANTRPADPSLTRTKLVLGAMFLEYQKAVQADVHHHPARKHIYRA